MPWPLRRQLYNDWILCGEWTDADGDYWSTLKDDFVVVDCLTAPWWSRLKNWPVWPLPWPMVTGKPASLALIRNHSPSGTFRRQMARSHSLSDQVGGHMVRSHSLLDMFRGQITRSHSLSDKFRWQITRSHIYAVCWIHLGDKWPEVTICQISLEDR